MAIVGFVAIVLANAVVAEDVEVELAMNANLVLHLDGTVVDNIDKVVGPTVPDIVVSEVDSGVRHASTLRIFALDRPCCHFQGVFL